MITANKVQERAPAGTHVYMETKATQMLLHEESDFYCIFVCSVSSKGLVIVYLLINLRHIAVHSGLGLD